MLRIRRLTSIVLAVILAFLLLIGQTLAIVQPWEEAFTPVPLETDPNVLQLNTASSTESTRSASYRDSADAVLEQTTQAYDAMIRSFYEAQPESQKYTDDSYTVSGIAESGFPDFYAGAYVNQNQNLVVLISDDHAGTAASLAASEQMIAAAAGSSDLIYASAAHPYSELVSIMDDIYQYQTLSAEQKDPRFTVLSYYIDDYHNCVSVGMEHIDAESIAAFREVVCDSDAVVFEQADEIELLTTVNPGSGYTNASTGATGSIGYRCRTTINGSTVYGFVTAAHCLETGEYAAVVLDNVALATAKRQFQGNMDAVFCRMVENHSTGTTISIANETLRDGVDVNLAQGHPISKVGIKTRLTSGTVTSTSSSYIYDNINFTDMLYSENLRADHGDSGGIVYSTRSGANYIAGIVSAGNSSRTYCTKAININTTLGLSLYD